MTAWLHANRLAGNGKVFERRSYESLGCTTYRARTHPRESAGLDVCGGWDLTPSIMRTNTGLAAWIAPRLALHLVHKAALCRSALRAERSLRHRGFELANGLPWLPTDKVLHDLPEAHTIAQAQQLQIGLDKLRRASGHFPGQVLALDPHRLVSYSQRDMVQRRLSAAEPATKQAQTFFLLDAHTRQPLCLTNATYPVRLDPPSAMPTGSRWPR